ncbi:MAG: fibrobacter succinogenes major paralogous domain-containing protein [Flavobacteriales bacterium]|nr:fibrobacter succinogenes major paralogous domain-containing protein [Flavobacteriales bacterium]
MRTSITILLPVLLFTACSPAQNEPARDPIDPEPASTSTMICGAEWMTRNLEATTYRNGDPIPQVTDPAAWAQLTTGAWCWYNNDSATYHRSGRLYNWYAVNDARGLAPQGWHVLTDAEWEGMETCLGEDSVGYRLRAAGQWPGAATMIDNSSGFHGLPSGKRSAEGTFSHADSSAVYWTANEGSVSEAWCGRLIHNANVSSVPSMITGVGYMNKAEGYAVRCVKDR